LTKGQLLLRSARNQNQQNVSRSGATGRLTHFYGQDVQHKGQTYQKPQCVAWKPPHQRHLPSMKIAGDVG